MSSKHAAGLSPQDLVETFLRHKGKALTFFVLTMVVVALVVLYWPRKYSSEGKLFVKLGRQSVTLDPTTTTGDTVNVLQSREVEINSMLEVLNSRALAALVVDQLGPDTILGTGGGSGESDTPAVIKYVKSVLGSLAKQVSSLDPVDDRERAVIALESSLDVSAKDSNVVAIRYTANSPQLAQQVVDTVMEAYLAEHVRINRTAGSHEFFDEQSSMLAKNLQGASKKLRDIKNRVGLITVAGQRDLLQQKIAAIELDVHTTTAELSAARARQESLAATIKDMPQQHATEWVTGLSNGAGDAMRDNLYDLEIRERELLSRLSDVHPLVVAIREQVKEARKIFEQQPASRDQTTSSLNQERRSLELAMHTERAQAASLEAELRSLAASRAENRVSLAQLNRDEVELTAAQREVDLLTANYQIYADKLEQARIDEALQSERISNVNVVQAASLSMKPVSPRKGITIVLGLFVALFGSVGLAVLAEWWDRTLRTPEDVEQELELPVLVSIPRMSSRHVMMN